MNNFAINIPIKVAVQTNVSFLLSIYVEVGITGSHCTSMLNLLNNR
jgi:hypothetical protein